jgi:signal transduction histidine kinase
MDYRTVQSDGSVRYFECQGEPVLDSQGQVVRLFGTRRNITERKHVEEKTLNALAKEKQLNELKSRFVSMISHEFRTPLTTIQSAAELLQHYEWSPEEQQERFQQIHAAVRQMIQLLEDVLLIGRVEAGKFDFNPKSFNLTTFCRQLVADTQLVTNRNHCLTFTSQGQAQDVWLDQKLMRQIVTNLLSNAIKYSPDGGNIELGLNYSTNSIKLWVKDEGIGIPPEAKDYLFDGFFRADNVSTIQGTGLGLTIVKKCVDLHQGTITLESEVGVGTTFTITLPLIFVQG